MTAHEPAAAVSGATTRHTDRLDPDPAEALAGLLRTAVPDHVLPPLWHWVYLLDRPRQDELGTDGHRRLSNPQGADTPLRRMFAGGRLTSNAPLRIGRPASRVTEVVGQQRKQGSSGPLTFITLRHRLLQDGEVCIVDEQDLVYRAAPRTGEGALDRLSDRTVLTARRADAGGADAGGPTVHCDSVLLFRFSALTYNSHRIHYDRAFARAEGYPDLVIHGPLQVLMMTEALCRAGHDFVGRRFTYRLIAPAFATQAMSALVTVSADAVEAEVHAHDGTTTATGRLETAPQR